MNRPAALACLLAASIATSAHADARSLEEAKASARRVAEATCPLVRLVSKLGKVQSGTPEYEALRAKIEDESKSLQDLKVQETEHLRSLGPQLTLKEGNELNDYIDITLAKICDPKY